MRTNPRRPHPALLVATGLAALLMVGNGCNDSDDPTPEGGDDVTSETGGGDGSTDAEDDAPGDARDSDADPCPDGPTSPLGDPCDDADTTCAYGYDPPECGGITVRCDGDTWIEVEHTDPTEACFDDSDRHACTEDDECGAGTCATLTGGSRFCAYPPSRRMHPCPGEFPGGCCNDSECAGGPLGEGYCVAFEVGYCGGAAPPEENTCRYVECETDTDCADGGICLLAGILGSVVNTCAPAVCASDADCTDGASGRCVPLYNGSTCPDIVFGCTYLDSGCRGIPDCDRGYFCVANRTRNDAECMEHMPAP